MNNTGKQLMLALKETAGSPGPQLGFSVPEFDRYFIRQIPTKREFIKERDVLCLTEWRNRNVNSFLTEFEATTERTFSWLCEALHFDDSRMLFMVEDRGGGAVGYMGIGFIDWDKSYVEADCIVSGGNSPRSLMSASLRLLLQWAESQLGLEKIGVRVLSDNGALDFYRKIGFVEYKRVPLKKIIRTDCAAWVEDLSLGESQRYLVHHMLSRS
jgi:RimJ/RimL family protein N-acetyltransferase